MEREEREERVKLEKEEKELREHREERRAVREKEERERKDIIFLKLIGLDSKKSQKYIKVQAAPENPHSQPLAVKLNLTTLSGLKKYI